MTGLDWVVIAGGTAMIAWINWYFFHAGRKSPTASEEADKK